MGNKTSEAYMKNMQALEMLLEGKLGYNYICEYCSQYLMTLTKP